MHEGVLHEGARLAATAGLWRRQVAADAAAGSPLAFVAANDTDSVALLFALIGLEHRVIVLPPRHGPAWHCSPPLPPDTVVCRVPSASDDPRPDAGSATTLRLETAVAAEADPWVEVRAPALIGFTSGTTGEPRPVFRPLLALLQSARATAEALALEPGDRIVSELPLSNLHGLNAALMLSAVLESELELIAPPDHRRMLRAFAARRHRCWTGSTAMADLLSRCRLDGEPPPSPPLCKISGSRLPARVRAAYARRFGVPLLQAYGSSEHGVVSTQRPGDEGPDAVGPPLAGVEIRIGPHPAEALPAGEVGPIWIRSPWLMGGYGFEPQRESPASMEGFLATADAGCLDGRGSLRLVGRTDDLFKTTSGHLVAPAQVEDALLSHPAVEEAVALPLSRDTGALIGALASGPPELQVAELLAHGARRLPEWARPQVLVVVSGLPRLPGGKPDRAACQQILEERS